VKATVVCITKY